MESFDEMVHLLSTSQSLDDLNDSLSEYLSHKKIKETENLKLTNQIINFLNNLIPIISDDNEKIANKNISNEEIGLLFIQKIKEFINNKFGNHFVNMDWQVSVLDRKNDTSNLNKSEKVEITTKINNFNANEQKYESHVIKMDFNEFTEIMTNFKKIDEQLHLFKN